MVGSRVGCRPAGVGSRGLWAGSEWPLVSGCSPLVRLAWRCAVPHPVSCVLPAGSPCSMGCRTALFLLDVHSGPAVQSPHWGPEGDKSAFLESHGAGRGCRGWKGRGVMGTAPGRISTQAKMRASVKGGGGP